MCTALGCRADCRRDSGVGGSNETGTVRQRQEQLPLIKGTEVESGTAICHFQGTAACQRASPLNSGSRVNAFCLHWSHFSHCSATALMPRKGGVLLAKHQGEGVGFSAWPVSSVTALQEGEGERDHRWAQSLGGTSLFRSTPSSSPCLYLTTGKSRGGFHDDW
jgi:hypothetical protein